MKIPLGFTFNTEDGKPGCWDSMTISLSGEIIIEGWKISGKEVKSPEIKIKGETLFQSSFFMISRKDVADHFPEAPVHCGLQFIYKMLPSHCEEIEIQLEWSGEFIGKFDVDARRVIASGWAWITDTDKVHHRDDIYKPGPPSRTITPDITDLFYGISESALDFGCGIGLYVQELRKRGIDCKGIELDRKEIREQMIPEIADHIQLYDGKFPLPYDDGSFEACICSEVLEHIENYEEALAEIARVTSKQLILTLPDFSSVATCAPHHVVPFHMLESTHVNFFNELSLISLLRNYFNGEIRLLKICPVITNDVKWFTSLAVIANKSPHQNR